MEPAPTLEQMLRRDPAPMLEAALSASGARLDSWRVDAVHARPGAETTVTYDVESAGERLYLIATTAEVDEATRARIGAVRLDSPAGTIVMWRHPADPRLPGLAAACVPEALGERLSRDAGAPIRVDHLAMLVLRPMRRAVLRAETRGARGAETAFIKVVRPELAARLLERHATCDLAPAARHLGDGVVAIAPAAGMALTTRLFRPTAPAHGEPVDPAVLLAALDALPHAAVELSRRPTPTDEVRRYAEAAIAAGLDRRRVSAVAEAVARGAARSPGPVVPTHGDFHAANLFVSGDRDARPTGLIDVDTMGPGYRVDDLACMLAHLQTLHDLDGEGYAEVPAYAARVREAFERTVDGDELRRRVAAVLLSLASGIGDPRLSQAWLARAEREVAADERTLTELS